MRIRLGSACEGEALRIKKLEIVGFKSFCDRTVITFDHPISGVVGPNGCGKSNIVDAVRWCMGEQSAKHLRGKAMDDVIFAGSDSRGPLGMAEVSLTFENTDGLVPVEYLAYAEITITRRLYRDGSSEYLINKVPARLRDIVDFFLGTGVGTKAYSIIEQGRVGMIVSSKPEERRSLIEEAAGITKYKVKKKAAERRMESTRANLLRVGDVLGELDKQLGSLRRQAQKAERYKKYREEMRDLELWSMSQRWIGAVAEARVVSEVLAEQAQVRDGALHELGTKDALISADRLAAADEERRLSGLQQALYELDNKIRLLESQAELSRRDARSLAERGQQARGEVEALGRRAAELAGEEETLRGELDGVLATFDADRAELAARDEALAVLRSEQTRAQSAIEDQRRAVGRADMDIARAEGEKKNLERRREEVVARTVRLREERMVLEERAASLEADLGGLRQRLEALGAEVEERRAQVRGDQGRLEEARKQQQRGEMELETLRTELHRRKSRLQSLVEIQDRYEGFQRGTRAIMQRAEREGVRGLVADIVQTPAELEAAVAAVLGERLGSILVESQEAGVDAVGYLKQKAEGRSTFIPVHAQMAWRGAGSVSGGDGLAMASGEPVPMTDSVPVGARALLDLVGYQQDYASVAGYLLGDTVLVDDLEAALRMHRDDSSAREGLARFTYVTREGDVIDRAGAVTGGSRDQGAGVLQQKREMRELEDIIGHIESDYGAQMSRHVEVRAEVQRLGEAIDEGKHALHEGELELTGLRKDVTRAEDEHRRSRERVMQLEGDEDELQGRQEEAVREAEAADVAAASGRERKTAAEAELERLGELAREVLFRVEEAQIQSTELRIRVATVGERKNALSAQHGRVTSEHASVEAHRERLERQIVADDEKSATLSAQATEAEAMLTDLATDSAARAQALTEQRTAYEAKQLELQEREVELRQLRSRSSALADEMRELERRLTAIESTRLRLEESADEKHRVVLKDEAHAHHLRALFGESEESRLRELRDLIDRMGEVNLSAIQEHDELSKRFEFLSGQKADLEDALDRLEKAIAKINRASKKRFEDTFNAINAKFQEVFPRLFRGGQARLALVPIYKRGQVVEGAEGEAPMATGDDILEAGLEIIAQPPGKKMQNVELMSGGEKALTAVSLIFSIFLIKPSPFCLLDEVDAPLDDANVIRYNEMIREMTDRTQFIVISHKKSTMTIADQLYGVTMEEPGISKIVGVNMRAMETKKPAPPRSPGEGSKPVEAA